MHFQSRLQERKARWQAQVWLRRVYHQPLRFPERLNNMGNIPCKSETLHVLSSYGPVIPLKLEVWHTHRRFDRLPQPEPGRFLLMHAC